MCQFKGNRLHQIFNKGIFLNDLFNYFLIKDGLQFSGNQFKISLKYKNSRHIFFSFWLLKISSQRILILELKCPEYIWILNCENNYGLIEIIKMNKLFILNPTN